MHSHPLRDQRDRLHECGDYHPHLTNAEPNENLKFGFCILCVRISRISHSHSPSFLIVATSDFLCVLCFIFVLVTFLIVLLASLLPCNHCVVLVFNLKSCKFHFCMKFPLETLHWPILFVG